MPQRNVKEQLVEGASKVLLERGYNGASVGDIVAAAGIPKGSVYNHFDSKEDLALEVVRRYVDSYPFGPLLAQEGSPMARLRTFFSVTIERTVARGVESGCLLGNFSTELVGHSDPISDLVAASLEQWGAAVTTVLAEAQEQGELGSDLDPAVLGPYLVDAFEGSVARSKVSGTRAPLDAFLDFTFDVLLKP
jgi:TetR/AcrR family transcriptional regulator, transcriptional repressor for nem operon